MLFDSLSDFYDDNVYSLPVTNSIMITISPPPPKFYPGY
jgi:hypothetical protein